MSKASEKSTLNVKPIVKPILFIMYHIHTYMGPCHYSEGYVLTTESDMEVTRKEFDIFKKEMGEGVDLRNVEFLEPVAIFWNEDFAFREEQAQKALEDDVKTNLYSIRGLRIPSCFAVELSKRTGKPIGHTLNKSAISKCGHVDMTAYLFVKEKPDYVFLGFEEVNRTFAAPRVRKALACTKVFFPLKSAVLTLGCQNPYLSLEDVTKKFKVRLSHVNSGEVFQWLDALTDKEKVEAKALADKPEKEFQGVHMPVEYILNDTEFYETIKEMTAYHSCNAFITPCFEVRVTRELNRRRLAFCPARSLSKDEGIASACVGDVGSVLTITIPMDITREVPYMENIMVLGKSINQCRTLHDVACAQMKGYGESALPTEFVSFTMDSQRTIMRYDFLKDNGETLTMTNMSPDMKRIMVAKDTINGCGDYLTPECRHAVCYAVKDAKRFYEYQKFVGRHFAFVYGDYMEEVEAFAKECDLEILEA